MPVAPIVKAASLYKPEILFFSVPFIAKRYINSVSQASFVYTSAKKGDMPLTDIPPLEKIKDTVGALSALMF